MRATGIVRRVDCVGRIVIPKEIRKNMNIKEGDPMELFLDGNSLIIQKYDLGLLDDIQEIKDKIDENVDDPTIQSVIREHLCAVEKLIKEAEQE